MREADWLAEARVPSLRGFRVKTSAGARDTWIRRRFQATAVMLPWGACASRPGSQVPRRVRAAAPLEQWGLRDAGETFFPWRERERQDPETRLWG